jgi:hypothetical protein
MPSSSDSDNEGEKNVSRGKQEKAYDGGMNMESAFPA